MAAKKLADNEWGFDVTQNNPFQIFRLLQVVAKESVGADAMIDLSRGDPGQGYVPTARGRRFYGYLCCLDAHLNNRDRRLTDFDEESFDELWKDIEEYTGKHFSGDYYDIMKDWSELFQRMAVIGQRQKTEYTKYRVVHEMFKNSALTGGKYLEPQGEPLVRAIIADSYHDIIMEPINYDDMVFFNGASHAMAGLLRGLGPDGIGFVGRGERVVMPSPTYAPYNNSISGLGLKSMALEVDYLTGAISEESFHRFENCPDPVKLIVLVDPNNPSGFAMQERDIERVCEIARKHNSLIITDEVYSELFPAKKTVIDFAPERTIRISAVSKIYVSCGLRFGCILSSKRGRQNIEENILKDYLPKGMDLMQFFIALKNPGTVYGEFKHITFVPGPSQYLGALHTLLGKTEKEQYIAFAAKNSQTFREVLELPHRGNNYYTVFDMNAVKGCKKQNVPPEQKLTDLAKKGVLFIPAIRFFDQEAREEADLTNLVRVSLSNDTNENLRRAAEITKEYLCS